MPDSPTLSDDQELAREQAERLAHWLDDAVPVPGTRMRFGLDALIGLIPGFGDLGGFVLGLMIIRVARRAGAPGRLQWQMLRNLLIEAVLGLMPVLGDAFDFFWKANRRNRELLDRWLKPEAGLPAPGAAPWLFAAALVALITGLLVWWLAA